MGDVIIAKRLDRFLVGEDLACSTFQLRQWVEGGGESGHNPMVLELKGDIRRPPIPFNFNSGWPKDPNFIAFVNENWNHLDLIIGIGRRFSLWKISK